MDGVSHQLGVHFEAGSRNGTETYPRQVCLHVTREVVYDFMVQCLWGGERRGGRGDGEGEESPGHVVEGRTGQPAGASELRRSSPLPPSSLPQHESSPSQSSLAVQSPHLVLPSSALELTDCSKTVFLSDFLWRRS